MARFKEISMGAVFQNQAAVYGSKACVSWKNNGVYEDISWDQLNEMVHGFGWYLLSLGIKKGDRVAIFSQNRYEWWAADLAIISIGAVNVPIYATNTAEEAQYILHHSETRLCCAGNADHLDRVLKVRKKLKTLKNLIVFDKPAKSGKDVVWFPDAVARGRQFKNKSMFDTRLKAIKPHDVASILYTSGTTGDPKGVMLSHNNFVSNVHQVIDRYKDYLKDTDIYLSFLPLSHALDRTAGYYLPVSYGAKVAFAEDISTIQVDLQKVRPTHIISVPRLYEKIHATILGKVADAPFIKRAMFNWATSIAAKNLPYVCANKPRTGIFSKQFELADKLVFSKLKTALGMDRMLYAISGGAPLSISDAEFFLGMGIIILEGYGLTETTPITNCNQPGIIKPGTVGLAVKDTIIKISDEGEILIKGPQVMLGYYKDPKATKAAFTKDGFFKTGDIGIIDDLGRLTITGRIKDIIVTAGGKNISPQNIENSLKSSKFIEQVAVIGDRRKYLTALIVPAFTELEKWAKRHAITYTAIEDLLENDIIQHLFQEEINHYTRQFSPVERIKKFKLLHVFWTQESGELTPTIKIKRRVIEKKYADLIDGMYEGD